MNDFHPCLKKCVASADLTVADLRYWFARPYPTCWRWLHSGYDPRGSSGKLAKARLLLLEHAIASQIGFPIPAELSARERPYHIMKTRYEIEHAHISANRPAKRRRKMRRNIPKR